MWALIFEIVADRNCPRKVHRGGKSYGFLDRWKKQFEEALSGDILVFQKSDSYSRPDMFINMFGCNYLHLALCALFLLEPLWLR